MTTRMLVAYATRHGSTAALAEAIGATVRDAGVEADVWPVGHCASIDAYDVVVLGSAVYMNRWLKDALAFAKRFEPELARRPTWFFSSGPTGGAPEAEAKLAEVLRMQPVAPGEAGRLARRIGIRGHATFGGRVGEDMTGLLERWLPRGDWQDATAVRAWSRSIADAISPDPPAPRSAATSRKGGCRASLRHPRDGMLDQAARQP